MDFSHGPIADSSALIERTGIPRKVLSRLFDSTKIYRIPMPFSADQINEACHQVVSANGLSKGAYLRPVVFRGYGEIGVAPKIEPPTEVAVAAWEWGKYLGAESEELGVDVCVSSWNRVAPNTLPALVAACRIQFEAETDALSRFENVLAQSGYSPAHEDEYRKMRLRVVEQKTARV